MGKVIVEIIKDGIKYKVELIKSYMRDYYLFSTVKDGIVLDQVVKPAEIVNAAMTMKELGIKIV